MSKQIIYLDELRKFITENKITQKKAAELAKMNAGNFNLMINGKLFFGEKPSKKHKAFNGTNEDRAKVILSILADYQLKRLSETKDNLDCQKESLDSKKESIIAKELEIISWRETLEI
jgi:hypothetical protein